MIPSLLMDRGRLVKTTRFTKPVYVGDPINTIRVFNDKGCDELLLLDIGAVKPRVFVVAVSIEFRLIEEVR